MLPKSIAGINKWKLIRSQYQLKRRKNYVTVKLSKEETESSLSLKVFKRRLNSYLATR